MQHGMYTTYMKGDVNHVPRLVMRCIDISEHLHPVRSVDIDVHFERLAEGLEMFGASPLAVSSCRGHHFLELPLLVLLGRS